MWVPQLQLFYFTHMPFSSLWGVFMIMLIGAIYIVCRHKPNLIKIHNKTESKAFSKNK
jgi:glycerol-3-phosphate acyltransferase PlsY